MYKKSLTGQIVLSPEHFSLGAGEFLGVPANTNLALAAPALLEALKLILDRYTGLINCGDCGNWNPEDEAEVIKARAAIAAARGE